MPSSIRPLSGPPTTIGWARSRRPCRGRGPTFFFAPDRLAKRTEEWGREGLEGRIAGAWRPFLEWTQGWLKVIHGTGPDTLERAYLELLDGRIDPAQAHVLSLPR